MKQAVMIVLGVIATCAAAARAQFQPLSMSRTVSVSSYGGPTINPGSYGASRSTTSMNPWSASITSPASPGCHAEQVSSLTPTGVLYTSYVWGSGGAGHGSGTGRSQLVLTFSVAEPCQYNLFTTVNLGGQIPIFRLNRQDGTSVFAVAGGVTRTGYLDAGTYTYEAVCSGDYGWGYVNSSEISFTVPSLPTAATFALASVCAGMSRRRRG